MDIVNKVQTFKCEVTFQEVKQIYPNYIEYFGRPTMNNVRESKNTILFLKNGRCRIMGNALEQNSVLSNLKIEIHDGRFITMTCVYNLHRNINCSKLPNISQFEPEIMVVAYTKMPEHVNVFPSGKVVLLGLK